MKTKILSYVFALACALAGSAAFGQGGNKIAIINMQDALMRTQEGQELMRELQKKYGPTRQRLESQRQELQSLRDQLSRGANTMSDEARRKLTREIQSKERSMQRDAEDAQQEFNETQQKASGAMAQKLIAVIDKHAKANGFSIVFDISAPQSPVLFALNEIIITNDVITLYDQDNPVADAPAAPAAAPPAAQ